MFDRLFEKVGDKAAEIDFVVHFGLLPNNPQARDVVENALFCLNQGVEGFYGSDPGEKQIARINKYFELAERFGFFPVISSESK